jgi:hypothetical protein
MTTAMPADTLDNYHTKVAQWTPAAEIKTKT